jgi:hypothetical protein
MTDRDDLIERFTSLCHRLPGFERKWADDFEGWMEANGIEEPEAETLAAESYSPPIGKAA